MPDWREPIRKQLAGLNLRPVREAEIVEELAQHAEDRYQELLSLGTTDAEACRIVIREFSGSERLAGELRAVEGLDEPEPVVLGAGSHGNLLAGLGEDLRYAFRTLRKSPGFTAVAVATLALGIGANTAVFSALNGVVLRPLSYPDPARLVTIYETSPEVSYLSVSYPNYLDWRRESRSFTDLGAYRSDDFNFTGSGEPEQVSGEYVSASLFTTLGVMPALGRNFRPQEDVEGAPCVVILSDGFWRQRFGADPDILGRVLTLNAANCAVVGVMPGDFRFQESARVYVPIEQFKRGSELRARESHPGIRVAGRLRPGATLAAAQAELASIAAVLARRYPAANAGHGVRSVAMKEGEVGYIRPTLLLLAGAVGFVLIIACANAANLLLARSTARKREFAIRAALGARPGRIIAQLLTESLLLSLAGAALGLLLARWGTRLALAAVPQSLPRAENIGIDPHVLLFTLALSLATGLLFGLAPAFHGSNASPQEFLKEGAPGSGGGRHRTESIFVTVEIALAVILLAGAGLMLQSLRRLWRVDPGFDTRQVLTAKVALSPAAMASPQATRLAYQQMLGRAAAIPGVEAAALTTEVPLREGDTEIPFWPGAGPQPAQDRLTWSMLYLVTQGYRDAMRIPLLRGRFLDERDTLASDSVVVIDEVLAQRIFAGQDPIGRQLSLMALGPVRVVGVVGHVKHWGLDADDTAAIRNQMYFPFMQVPDRFISGAGAGTTLVLRTVTDPLGMVPAVRVKVAGPTRDQPVYSVRTLEQIVAGSLATRRFIMLALGVFAATALLLAAGGIYSVMSYAVARRTHELGIRSALGASRSQIARLVVRHGMRLAATGMAGGLAAALALTRLMRGFLYGVRPADPVTLAGVLLLLGGIALLACYIPAQRATAVDPVIALRCE
jgi:predicted permease